MAKKIRLYVGTGFCGATHEEEIPYEGQTDDEIQSLLDDFRDEVIGELDPYYEIEDEEDE